MPLPIIPTGGWAESLTGKGTRPWIPGWLADLHPMSRAAERQCGSTASECRDRCFLRPFASGGYECVAKPHRSRNLEEIRRVVEKLHTRSSPSGVSSLWRKTGTDRTDTVCVYFYRSDDPLRCDLAACGIASKKVS